MALIPTTAAQIAEFADALYGVEIGNSTYTFVNNDVTLLGGLNNTLNSFYTYSFGSQTTATVAATVVNNVGIIAGKYGLAAADVTAATTYVQSLLDAAQPGQRGAVINSILNGFATLSTGVYAQAAAAWQGTVSVITGYMGVSTNTTDLPLTPGVPLVQTTTYNLTTGMDNIAPAGNATINGVLNAAAATVNQSTFTGLDKIAATGTGNVFNINDVAGGQSLPGGVSVSGVQTVNLASAGTTVADSFSSWTGLTTLNVTEIGGAAGITAAATTAVTLTDSGAATAGITVNGGAAVTITASGVTGAGSINVGTSAATGAAGAISITENVKASATTATVDAINTYGGTTVTINENLAGATNNTITSGVVTVNGGSATTTVTVNQTAPAGAAAAIAANAGVAKTVAAVTAAPGVQGVSAATATQVVAAQAAVSGVNNGVVHVIDANSASTTLANTITSVTLSSYGTGSTIADNALTTLSVSGVNSAASTLTLTNAAAAPTNTTLALTLNGMGTTGNATTTATVATIADANNEIKTLNVTTAGNDSNVIFSDTHLTTLNVSGTNTLNLSTLGGATIGTIAVSGSAGFSDNGLLAGEGVGLTSFTTTSSGTITATLNDTNQTFTGSSGQDVITISADATKVIKGGSATNNEIVMNNTFATFNATSAKLTNTNVTGFTTLGLTNSSTGTWDMSTMNSGFNNFDVQATTAAISIIKAAAGASLNIANTSTAGGMTLQYADTTGLTDTTNLSIAESSNGTGSATPTTAFSVTLQDANSVGVGTLNVTSNGSDTDVTTAAAAAPWGPTVAGAYNAITTLVDNGLSSLHVTGGAGLYIGTLNEVANQATSFTVNSAETGILGTVIGAMTDIKLGALNFTGSNSTDIQNLSVAGGTVTTFAASNTGTGAVTIGDGTAFADAAMTSLTLSGSIHLVGGTIGTLGTATTVAAGTDNAQVTLTVAGAGATGTDSLTLGNANNNITDGSLAGTVNLTVGTGANLITLGASATDTTGAYNVTLGSHTPTTTLFDKVVIGSVAGATAAAVTAANLTVTGAAGSSATTGDVVSFSNDAAATMIVTKDTTSVFTSVANAVSTLASEALAAGAHNVEYAVYSGNTYVVESLAAAAAAHNWTAIELVGSHTIATTGAATGTIVVTA